MATNINFDKKLGITGVTGISLPSSSTPSYQNEYSFQFDGVDDYIDCNSAASSISADNEGTISVWVNPNNITSNQTILNFSASTQTRQYLTLSLNSTYGLYVDMRENLNSSSGFFVYANVNPFSVGAWTHLAIVQNGVSPQLYVNGVAVAQTFLVSTNDQKWLNDMSSFDSINIGRIVTSNLDQNYFDGLVDEFSYFSSALSSTDIETIWNNGVPNNLNELSTLPTIWYRMGEAATFDGIRDWDLVDQGTGGNNAVSQNIAETERVTDVPPNPFANTKSILLDGIDDLVTMGDVLNMANDGTDAFSYSVWYKTTDTASFQMFIGKQRAAVWFNGVTFSMRGDLKNFNVFLGTGQGNQRIKGKTSTISDINDGNWHHVCLTYDGSQVLSGMTLYYDNTQIALSVDGTQGTPTNVSTSGQADFIIGARGLATSPNLPFNGNLDEVSYFTSELTASDVTSIYGTGVPNDISSLNPIGWWRCGDGDTSPTLTDNGSGGNDGTMTNFSTFSTDVPTFNTKSILLDGIDDTINIGATPLNLRFNRLDTFSFSAWVKVDTTQNNVIVANQRAPSTNYRGYYFAVNSSNKVIVLLRSTLSDRLIYTSTTTLTNGIWYHIVFTYDGTATTTGGNIYINNSLDTLTRTGTLTGTMESFDTLYLGCRSNSDNFFKGTLDEISIFNAELSQSDVTTIYNSGVPNDIASLSPVSWWRCGDEDTAPTLTDNGSGGNNGTMTNFTTFSTDVPT